MRHSVSLSPLRACLRICTVVTLASGLIAAIPQIANNPGSAVTLLAQQLPSASTFFLTFFVTSLFSGAAGMLLQVVPLVLFYVFLMLLGSTPRKCVLKA